MTSKEYFQALKNVLSENKLRIKKYTVVQLLKFEGDLAYRFSIKGIPNWEFGLIFKNDIRKSDVVYVEFYATHKDSDTTCNGSGLLSICDELFTGDPDIDIYDMGTTFDIIGLCRLIKYYPVLAYLMERYSWHAYDYFGVGRYLRYLSLRVGAIAERCVNRLTGGTNK